MLDRRQLRARPDGGRTVRLQRHHLFWSESRCDGCRRSRRGQQGEAQSDVLRRRKVGLEAAHIEHKPGDQCMDHDRGSRCGNTCPEMRVRPSHGADGVTGGTGHDVDVNESRYILHPGRAGAASAVDQTRSRTARAGRFPTAHRCGHRWSRKRTPAPGDRTLVPDACRFALLFRLRSRSDRSLPGGRTARRAMPTPARAEMRHGIRQATDDIRACGRRAAVASAGRHLQCKDHRDTRHWIGGHHVTASNASAPRATVDAVGGDAGYWLLPRRPPAADRCFLVRRRLEGRRSCAMA